MSPPEQSRPDSSPLRALANPTRLRIMSMLTGRNLSATQVSLELGIRHGSASYHLRQLQQAGLIDTAEVLRVNGGVEQRYRYRLPSEQDAPRSPWNVDDLLLVIEALATEMRRRAMSSKPGLSAAIDGEYWLPLETWKGVRSDIQAATRRLHTAAQPAHASGMVHVSASALLFEMRDQPPETDE